MEEIEVKFLNIDEKIIEQKLLECNAQKIGETVSQICCFDYPDYRLATDSAWIRLRTEFGKTELTYKQRLGVTSQDGSTKDQGMKEINTIVSDFETTKEFLLAIGLIEKFTEERKRVRYIKDTVEIDIDTWPLLKPYVEIEGTSWNEVEKTAELLGLNWEDHIKCSAMQVYALSGINENDYKVLTFKEQIKK